MRKPAEAAKCSSLRRLAHVLQSHALANIRSICDYSHMPAERDPLRNPSFALPGWSKQPSGLFLPLSLDVARVEPLPRELAEPPRPVAAVRPASWSDQITPWAESEAFGIPAMPPWILADRFVDLPLEPTLMALATIQRTLGNSRDLSADQPQLISDFLLESELAVRARAFLRAYPGGVIFFEQQVYVAQKLAMLYADPDRDDELGAEELSSLIVSILAITSGIIDRANDPRLRTPTRAGQLLPMFFGGAHFAHREWIGATLTRGLEIFGEAAADPPLRSDKQYCDLAEWLDDAYRLTLEELLAGGLGLASAAKLLTPEEPFQQVDAESLRPYLGDATDGVLKALVADLDWFRGEFSQSMSDVRYLARDVTPFFKRPFWQRSNGTVVPLGPRVVQEALSDHGLFFRFHDLARKHKGGVQRYSNFAGKPYERYALQLARQAVERPKTTVELVGRVHGEVWYQRRKSEGAYSPDVTIDYGPDVVMVELTSSHLTQETLIEATQAAVKKDIEKIVTEKLSQLDDRIRDARKGHIPIDGIDFEKVKRFWPVLVITEPLLQTDLLWDEIDRACRHAFQHPRVAPPTIITIEEYECLIGDVKAGYSLVSILGQKTQVLWARRDLRSWHRDDRDAIGEMGLPEQERRFSGTMKRLLDRLQRDHGAEPPVA
jgi:hypothetical protein